jgi:hypothetical protein
MFPIVLLTPEQIWRSAGTPRRDGAEWLAEASIRTSVAAARRAELASPKRSSMMGRKVRCNRAHAYILSAFTLSTNGAVLRNREEAR